MSEVVTILAVDDDSMHTELIGNIMSEVGCRVIKCFNGLEAVQILEQIPEIDAILVDLQMPVMNGHELISFVKQSTEWQHIPLVALTGNPHEVTHTLSLGASEFLAKPFNREEMQLRVMNQVRTKKRADQARKELQKTEARCEQLLQSTDQGIYSIDMDGLCTFINSPGLQILGYQAEELVGSIITPLLQNEALVLSSGLTSTPIPANIASSFSDDNLLLCRKDGTLFPASYSSHPLIEHGVMVGAVITFSDITERKRMLEELTAAKELAEAASLAKSSFLATMSHEIRTPMNGVLGMNNMLLETKLTTEQKEFAEIACKSGENLLTIINEILDFSKIEAGKLDLEILDFDLRVTLEDAAELLALRGEEVGLELICRIDPAVPSYLRGDPGRIRQIITNLVGNAIKFTRKGEVVISATMKSDRDEQVTVLFEIQDTGIGIPASRLSAIFDPFTQADGSTTRKFGGTGLGLAICKQLAELMGGEIGVKSEEGIGSTFWFTLCLEKQEIQSADAYRALQLIGQGRLAEERILVVDDNATNRILMKNLLRLWGCRHEVAAHGAEGLEMLFEAVQAGDPFRIAVLDQEMPDMDGMELGRRIKTEPLLESTLLVMLTSIAQRGDAAILEQIGFAGYLHKPVRQAQLYDCLELVLGRDIEAKESHEPGPLHGIITRHIIAESGNAGGRLLLVEDNIINQKVAQHMLKSLGYRVDVAADGQEAVRALEMIDYNLVLMDCMMPVMNGFEATAAIRRGDAGARNSTVPIIAMTANATIGDREKCLESGMNDYLSKPIKKELLADLIEKWLEYNSVQITNTQVNGDAMSETILFDYEEMLENMDNDTEFIQSILEESTEALVTYLETLQANFADNDSAAIRILSHTMKGVAANISAPALKDTCLRIEAAAKDGDIETAREILPELAETITRTIEAIKTTAL